MKKTSCTLFLIASVCFSMETTADTLTRRMALKLMMQEGTKWQQTKLLTAEASAQQIQAHAVKSPYIQAISREIVGRINQIQFGFDSPGDLHLYTLGATAIDGAYMLVDKASMDRLMAANQNIQLNAHLEKQFQNDLTYLMLIQYLNVQRLKRKLEIIDINIQRDSDILNLAKAKVKAGAGIQLDLLRAQGLVAVDDFRKLNASTSYTTARQDFFVLLGKPDLQSEFPPLLSHEIQKPIAEESLKALVSRPDILAAHTLVQVTESLRHQAEDEPNIKVSLFGNIGVVGTHVIGGVGNALAGNIGIQASIPLWDGNFNSGKLQEASVKVTRAELQAKQTEMDATSQIKASLLQLNDTKKAIETSKLQTELAEAELRLARKRFLSGTAAGLELANAQTTIASAFDTSVDAAFSYEIAKVNYFKATGDFEKYLSLEEGNGP